MNVGRAIGYVFHDPHWARKVLIGGLLFFVPIFGWLVIPGFGLRVVRQVAQGADASMPEWDQFRADFVRGLKWWVVTAIWSIPIWVIEILEVASNRSDSSYTSILAIIIGFFLPLANSRLAITNSIGEAIDFVGIFNEAGHTISPLLLVLVVSFVLGLVAVFGVFLFIIGVLFTIFIDQIILSHLYGQLRRAANREPPLPPRT